MSKKETEYLVCIVYGADKTVRVKAEDPDEAIDIAHEKEGYVSLCHQCSSEISVNDPVFEIVMDKDGNELFNTDSREKTIERLEAEVAELKKQLEEAKK